MVKYLGNEWLSGMEVNVYSCAYHEWNQIQLLRKVRRCFEACCDKILSIDIILSRIGMLEGLHYFAQVERSPEISIASHSGRSYIPNKYLIFLEIGFWMMSFQHLLLAHSLID